MLSTFFGDWLEEKMFDTIEFFTQNYIFKKL